MSFKMFTGCVCRINCVKWMAVRSMLYGPATVVR